MPRRKRVRLSELGFTLLETLIIVVVFGVLTAIAAPSFLSLMNGVKINQTITEVRGTLQEGQRQAIRNNQPCTVSLFLPDGTSSNTSDDKTNNGNRGTGNDNGVGNKPLTPSPPSEPTPPTSIQTQCPTSQEPEVKSGVGLTSNITRATTSSDEVAIAFGIYGSAEFDVVGQVAGASTGTQDPSGKIVAYIPTRENVQKKCIAISNTLGLTRVGNYTGGVTPEEITTDGVCTALDWTTQ